MTDRMRIVVGSDDAGYQYKMRIAQDLRDDPRVLSVEDLGVDGDALSAASYGEVAIAVGERIKAGAADRGVLICGTGIGMAIAANKVTGIRATVAHDPLSVERSIMSNNCQILTLGQRIIGIELARRLVQEWLGYTFNPDSPSSEKVAVITGYERS